MYIQFQRNDIGTYIADVIVTFFGITSLTIIIWYTAMGIMNDKIFPDDRLKSYLSCVIAGYVLCLIFLAFPAAINWFTRQLSKLHIIAAFVFVELVKFMALICYVLLWRGAWQLVDQHVLEQMPWRNWLCHFGSVCMFSWHKSMEFEILTSKIHAQSFVQVATCNFVGLLRLENISMNFSIYKEVYKVQFWSL